MSRLPPEGRRERQVMSPNALYLRLTLFAPSLMEDKALTEEPEIEPVLLSRESPLLARRRVAAALGRTVAELPEGGLGLPPPEASQALLGLARSERESSSGEDAASVYIFGRHEETPSPPRTRNRSTRRGALNTEKVRKRKSTTAVSYTHLTLPTILLV